VLVGERERGGGPGTGPSTAAGKVSGPPTRLARRSATDSRVQRGLSSPDAAQLSEAAASEGRRRRLGDGPGTDQRTRPEIVDTATAGGASGQTKTTPAVTRGGGPRAHSPAPPPAKSAPTRQSPSLCWRRKHRGRSSPVQTELARQRAPQRGSSLRGRRRRRGSIPSAARRARPENEETATAVGVSGHAVPRPSVGRAAPIGERQRL
jgi:hypothetical protein